MELLKISFFLLYVYNEYDTAHMFNNMNYYKLQTIVPVILNDALCAQKLAINILFELNVFFKYWVRYSSGYRI